MENNTPTLKDKINSFKNTWKHLESGQKVSLSMMLVLLVAIPVGVILSLSPTRLFSRAFPNTIPITSPVTPPDTPPPTRTILLNSASGKSCNALCSERNLTCQSVGTDSNATNGKSWQTYKNSCAEVTIACDGKLKKTGNRLCFGNTQPWTNCLCQ